ncbi:methyltransferase domain-containing protein [Kitasatospora sp. NPDC058218]|uniref:methyltransferase domain-containing protein n=1 Tax=Kitasatospora sp. NPDC058218 TaxID=3346385 RepID=UPI0036DAC317
MTDSLPEGADRPGSEPGRSLLSDGSMSPAWADTFDAVPRALFAPDIVWSHDMASGRSVVADRRTDPAGWVEAIDANVPLVTQWDDGTHRGTDPGTVATSSISMPSLVASMLRDLDVRPGMKVYEGGTGPGWNAALLAHRLGSAQVVSVEYDEEVSKAARINLARAGLRPELVIGDGAAGWSRGGPYDRAIFTYGLRAIPAPVVRQVHAGGMILAPWGTDFTALDAVVKLTVNDDGSVSGPFTQMVEFMKSRNQRLEFPQHSAYVPDFPGDADTSCITALMPEDLGGYWDVRRFSLGLAVPDATHVVHQQDDGTTSAWFYGLTDRSWAAVVRREGDAVGSVYQSGPRQLWPAVERALDWWQGQGRPSLERFGLSVINGSHTTWLDTPDNVVPTYR